MYDEIEGKRYSKRMKRTEIFSENFQIGLAPIYAMFTITTRAIYNIYAACSMICSFVSKSKTISYRFVYEDTRKNGKTLWDMKKKKKRKIT